MTAGAAASRSQVAALVAVRWRMVRRRRVRVGLAVVGVAALLLLIAAAAGGHALGPRLGDEADVILPSLLLGFLLLCVIAPIAAGGGFELVPAEQLVAFPVRHRTVMAVSLLLVPLNVAWFVLLLSLIAATVAATGTSGAPIGPLLTLSAYVVAATVLGHAIAWLIVGLRRRRSGRLLVWAGVVIGGLVAVAVAVTGRLDAAVESLPTGAVTTTMTSWAVDPARACLGTVLLLAVAGAGWLVGVAGCGWALRRTGDLAGVDPAARPVRRRAAADDVGLLLRRVERAGVLRSAPLRRGLAVIVVLPAGAAAVADLPWDSLVLLPPLVASGAALLYGVNAFALEGSGALFLASAPLAHRAWLRAKARVVLESVALAVAAAVVAGSLRAGWPDALAVSAVALSAISCALLVTSTCMHLSVARPHRAELRGPRDTPAPPGTMALYSVRLATTTTLVGLVFAMGTIARSWPTVVLMTAASLLLAARSWHRTRRSWDDPRVRAHVVATVAAG